MALAETRSDLPPPQRPGSGANRRFRMTRTVLALMLREMSTRYGRSPGGYLWAVLEPLGGIFVLAIGFSLIIRNPPLGTSFVLFYASGFVPFNLYQGVSLMVSRALGFSRPLLFYPTVTWVDALVARFLLNALVGIMVGLLVLAIVLTVADTRSLLSIGPILFSVALALLLGAGVGALNCALVGLIDVWDVVWSIITRPLFLASGVIFLYEDMPPLVQDVLWWNPLVHILAIMRTGIYPTYSPDYVSVPFVLIVSLLTLAMGVVLLGRYHRDILNR